MRIFFLGLLTLASQAAAAWTVQPGPPVETCTSSTTLVQPGPKGVEYVQPPPVCVVTKTGHNTWHFVDRLISAQQTAPPVPCEFERGRLELDGRIYGRFKGGGSLWAVCAIN